MKNQIKLSEVNEAINLGSHDEGDWGQPGRQGHTARVDFFLLTNGDYRAKINTEYGSNQGYHQVNGGAIERIDCGSLADVITEATAYCESLPDNAEILRSLRLAANEARNWERKNEVVTETKAVNPLAEYSLEQLEAELALRATAKGGAR